MSAGYDSFYWLDRELDKEYEDERKELEENDKKRISKTGRNAVTSDS